MSFLHLSDKRPDEPDKQKKPEREQRTATDPGATAPRVINTFLGSPFTGTEYHLRSGGARSGTHLWTRGDHVIDALACVGILFLCWFLTVHKAKQPITGALPVRGVAIRLPSGSGAAPSNASAAGRSLALGRVREAVEVRPAAGAADRQTKPVAIIVSSSGGGAEQLAETALERYGYSVHRARNGREAVQIAGRDARLVLMMDGEDEATAAQLRGLRPDVNIVVASPTATFAQFSDQLGLSTRPVKR
jgi:hypothetical protein